jgi:hypothetical protein
MKLRTFSKNKVTHQRWLELIRSSVNKSEKNFKRTANNLRKKGVPPKFFVWVLRNGSGTLGAYFFDHRSAFESLEEQYNAQIKPRGYNIDFRAEVIDGRKFMLIRDMLKEMWERYPSEWEEYLNTMQRLRLIKD